MKYFATLFTLSIIFLFCKEQKQVLKFLPPEWEDGETTRYALIVKEDTVGELTYKINYVEEGYKIDALTRSETKGQKSFDRSIITIQKNTLKPLKAERTIEAQGMTYVINADYRAKSVKINLKAPQGEKSTEMTLTSENSYDNEMITMLLRNIPFEEGFQAKITSIVPLSASSFPLDVNVMGKEKMNVPAGEFETRKINLKFAGREVNIWYNEASPKQMVKYEDKQSKVIMVLMREK